MAGLRRDPQRRAGFLGDVAKVGRAALVAGDHQRERSEVDDLLQGFPALAGIERIEPLQLLSAEDLQLVRVDDVEVTHQRGAPRAVFLGFQRAVTAGLSGQPAQSEAVAVLLE